MPTSKDMSSYPEWFFTIAERASKHANYSEEVRAASRGAAINLRQRFYSFRQLLSQSGHPHTAGAMSLQLVVRYSEEGWKIVFTQAAGLAEGELERLIGKPAAAISTPADAPDRIERSDDAERALEDLLGIKRDEQGRAPEASSSQACPPHEWDELQTHCLTCGAPYEK